MFHTGHSVCVAVTAFPHHCRHGPEASVRRMPPADHRQIPAQSHRLPLARGVCAVRGVRGRAPELLLSAGPQTLLQAGLCGVSARLSHHFSTRSRILLSKMSEAARGRSSRRIKKKTQNNLQARPKVTKKLSSV